MEIDVDVISIFFKIQRAIILYNEKVFLANECVPNLLDLGMLLLHSINESRMQRRVIDFLYACIRFEVFAAKSQKLFQSVMKSIPILCLPSYDNAVLILMFSAKAMEDLPSTLAATFKSKPYLGLRNNTVEFFLSLIPRVIGAASTLTEGKQERIMCMIAKDLAKLAKHGEVPHRLKQLEQRYAQLENIKEYPKWYDHYNVSS